MSSKIKTAKEQKTAMYKSLAARTNTLRVIMEKIKILIESSHTPIRELTYQAGDWEQDEMSYQEQEILEGLGYVVDVKGGGEYIIKW